MAANDPSASSQTIKLRVPEDGPFTYGGTAVGFVWMAVAREQRSFRSDPRRIAISKSGPALMAGQTRTQRIVLDTYEDG